MGVGDGGANDGQDHSCLMSGCSFLGFFFLLWLELYSSEPTSSESLSLSDSSPASKSQSSLSSSSSASAMILDCSVFSMMTLTWRERKYQTRVSSSALSMPMNSTSFFSSLMLTLRSNCLLAALMRWNSVAQMSSTRKQSTGLGMNIMLCLSMQSQPGWALMLALRQGWLCFDLKWLPGWMRLMLAVAWRRSTKTWNWGPVQSCWSSERWGAFSRSSGLTLVLMSTAISFLIWMTMQRQTVCPWQMGRSLLSWRTMETWASLVMGRMKPLVMLRYSTLQLKVIPWNRMLFWQKSTVYLPRGTARFTSSIVAMDSPANSPIFARSTICRYIFSTAPSRFPGSPSSSIRSAPSSSRSLPSSTCSRISHRQSSLPRWSAAVSMMMSCLLMVELVMEAQSRERRGWFGREDSVSFESCSICSCPQFSPLKLMAPIQLLQRDIAWHTSTQICCHTFLCPPPFQFYPPAQNPLPGTCYKSSLGRPQFSLLMFSFRALRVFMKMDRQASSACSFRLPLVGTVPWLPGPASLSLPSFSVTIAVRIPFISSVLRSISTSFWECCCSRSWYFQRRSLFLCSSFSQLSLAMRMRSLRQVFQRRKLLTSDSTISLLFCSISSLEVFSVMAATLLSRSLLLSSSDSARKLSPLSSCLFLFLSFSNSHAISRFLCSRLLAQLFISRTTCNTFLSVFGSRSVTSGSCSERISR